MSSFLSRNVCDGFVAVPKECFGSPDFERKQTSRLTEISWYQHFRRRLFVWQHVLQRNRHHIGAFQVYEFGFAAAERFRFKPRDLADEEELAAAFA